MIRKYDLPDEITLPCGAVLKPVIGNTLDGKPFIDACHDEHEISRRISIELEAKRRGLKFRAVSVLSRNLRGKLDLHGRPYAPTHWAFVEVKRLSPARVTVQFNTREDARNFLAYVERAKAQDGTVTGVYAGVMCSALKRATIKQSQA